MPRIDEHLRSEKSAFFRPTLTYPVRNLTSRLKKIKQSFFFRKKKAPTDIFIGSELYIHRTTERERTAISKCIHTACYFHDLRTAMARHCLSNPQKHASGKLRVCFVETET